MPKPIDILFNLELPFDKKELSVPLLLARKYSRKDIVACFVEMQEKGFGIFLRGSQGRNNFGKFIPNDKMPKSYLMIMALKK